MSPASRGCRALQRYFDWELQDGAFRYFEHPVNLPRELAFEGKYVIQTEEQNLSPVEAVPLYKSQPAGRVHLEGTRYHRAEPADTPEEARIVT